MQNRSIIYLFLSILRILEYEWQSCALPMIKEKMVYNKNDKSFIMVVSFNGHNPCPGQKTEYLDTETPQNRDTAIFF